MNGSRAVGLLLPTVYLLALAAGVTWYWLHRHDD
ncbi:hypothetical protein GA0115233_104312 [Streptomyces sp. DI166]|nr:hypothetical protein GA0115233_104312 [Streptomyces sp. DI166]